MKSLLVSVPKTKSLSIFLIVLIDFLDSFPLDEASH